MRMPGSHRVVESTFLGWCRAGKRQRLVISSAASPATMLARSVPRTRSRGRHSALPLCRSFLHLVDHGAGTLPLWGRAPGAPSAAGPSRQRPGTGGVVVREGLDLQVFCDRIKARGGTPGRPATDPRILLALWLRRPMGWVGPHAGAAVRTSYDLSLDLQRDLAF